MATAIADGNLIVPVIKNADHLNMVGLAKAVNDLANRARRQELKPEEVQGGTFTFTNIGNFGSLTGTPIINQPQVGIVAVGEIRKMPAVIESSHGDSIAIGKRSFRSVMIIELLMVPWEVGSLRACLIILKNNNDYSI